MPKPEYIEGPQALANFQQLATVIMQANPKKKKKQIKKSPSLRKSKKSDRD
jgi:hypothetical protein